MIALGAVMQRTGFCLRGVSAGSNRVTYWLGLRALFSQLAGSVHEAGSREVDSGRHARAMALVVATGYLLAWIMRVPGPSWAHSCRRCRGERGFCRSSHNLFTAGCHARERPLGAGRSIIVVAPMMVVFQFRFRPGARAQASIRSAFRMRSPLLQNQRPRLKHTAMLATVAAVLSAASCVNKNPPSES